MTDEELVRVREAVDDWASRHPAPGEFVIGAGKVMLSPKGFAEALHAPDYEDQWPYKIINLAAGTYSIDGIVEMFTHHEP